MKFKIDENLRAEAAEILRESGFVADTVADEELSGSDDELLAGVPPIPKGQPMGGRFFPLLLP